MTSNQWHRMGRFRWERQIALSRPSAAPRASKEGTARAKAQSRLSARQKRRQRWLARRCGISPAKAAELAAVDRCDCCRYRKSQPLLPDGEAGAVRGLLCRHCLHLVRAARGSRRRLLQAARYLRKRSIEREA
uniref:Putative recombination endonuclease VII n=1 Tax=viral metagenome TaxID=1070528 RepID=A0A6M3LKH8_9ZZZZ